MNQIAIGKFITKKRKEQNLTQEQLAEKLGVSNKTVSKWETGKCMPDYAVVKSLCDELKITIAELIDGEETAEKGDCSYDKQIMLLLRRTQELERQKNLLFSNLLIVMGIALLALSQTVGGSTIQDFISGFLLGISVVEMLIGVYLVGRSISGQ